MSELIVNAAGLLCSSNLNLFTFVGVKKKGKRRGKKKGKKNVLHILQLHLPPPPPRL